MHFCEHNVCRGHFFFDTVHTAAGKFSAEVRLGHVLGAWRSADRPRARIDLACAAKAVEAANARDGDDETPLHMAARGGYPGIVRMLLAAGAKADAKSAAGLFPWNYAEDGSELHALLPRCE